MKTVITNREIYNCFNTPDGKKALEWMNRMVSANIVRKDKEGRIDPIGTACAGTLHDLINEINTRYENGKLGR